MNHIMKSVLITLDTAVKPLIIGCMDIKHTPSIWSLSQFLGESQALLLASLGAVLLMVVLHPYHPCPPLGLQVGVAVLLTSLMGFAWLGAHRTGLSAFLNKWVQSMEHGAACLLSPHTKPRSLRRFLTFIFCIPSKSLKLAFSQPKLPQAPNQNAA